MSPAPRRKGPGWPQRTTGPRAGACCCSCSPSAAGCPWPRCAAELGRVRGHRAARLQRARRAAARDPHPRRRRSPRPWPTTCPPATRAPRSDGAKQQIAVAAADAGRAGHGRRPQRRHHDQRRGPRSWPAGPRSPPAACGRRHGGHQRPQHRHRDGAAPGGALHRPRRGGPVRVLRADRPARDRRHVPALARPAHHRRRRPRRRAPARPAGTTTRRASTPPWSAGRSAWWW